MGSPMSEDGNNSNASTPTRGHYDRPYEQKDNHEDVTETLERLTIEQSLSCTQDSSQIIGK